MTAKTFADTLSADGEYSYEPSKINHARAGILEVYGTFGGGTVTPGYADPDGAFVAFQEEGSAISVSASCAWEVSVPASGTLAVKVAGSTAPAIKVAFRVLG